MERAIMNADGLQTYRTRNFSKSRRLLTGLSVIAIVGILLAACGAGISVNDSPQPGLSESSTPLPTESPSPQKSPILEPTLTQTAEPTVDPEMALALELADKAERAMEWVGGEMPVVKYENLDQYMEVLVKAERAVDWDVQERTHSFQMVANSTIMEQPDHTRAYFGSNWSKDY